MARGKGRRQDTLTAAAARDTERFRNLKKRYMKVCKENARLKKALSKYEQIVDTNEEVVTELPEITTTDWKCPKCKSVDSHHMDLGQLTITTCNECGYKDKKRNSHAINT